MISAIVPFLSRFETPVWVTSFAHVWHL